MGIAEVIYGRRRNRRMEHTELAPICACGVAGNLKLWKTGLAVVNCRMSKRQNAVYDFVIVLRNFRKHWFAGGWRACEFKLFGQLESISYQDSLYISINVTKYSDKEVSGYILGVKSPEDMLSKLGDFRLWGSGSEYKGEVTDIVYDMRRYTKELLFD